MPGSEPQYPVVTRHIRKLRGGSQPILAEASDGNTYVVKFSPNLQGRHVLFNESIGTELYRACGLQVSPWKVLRVTNSFLHRNRSCWMETPEEMRKPAAGLCFGSLFLGGQNTDLFEILPGGYFQRVKNAADFWLAWLVDVCASHSDLRQAVFCQEPSRQLKAVFIDFGHMLGGPDGDKDPHFRVSLYRDERIYPPPNPEFLLTIKRFLSNLDTYQIFRAVAKLPERWRSESAEQALSTCLNRLLDSQFVEKTLDALVDSLRPSPQDDRFPLYAASSGISVLPPPLRAKTKARGAVA